MGVGFAAALPYLSAGMSAASGIAGMMGAKSQAEDEMAQAEFTRRQSESAASDEMLAATQEEVIRRRELNDTLSTLDAIRSSRGLSLTSPTGQVQARTIGNVAADNIRIGKLNRLTRSTTYKSQASLATQQGKRAVGAGTIGMLSSLATGVSGSFSALNSAGIFDGIGSSYDPRKAAPPRKPKR